jgi:hypothetical protein
MQAMFQATHPKVHKMQGAWSKLGGCAGGSSLLPSPKGTRAADAVNPVVCMHGLPIASMRMVSALLVSSSASIAGKALPSANLTDLKLALVGKGASARPSIVP